MKKLRLLILALCVALTAGATDHQKTAAMSDAAAKPDADSLLRLGRKFVRANSPMSCVITDLENEAGNALGTQVTIIIPLMEGNGEE